MSAVPTPDPPAASSNELEAPDVPDVPKPSGESRVGSVVGGRYRLVRVIGEGGTSAVFEAEHVHMHKKVAVKVLSSHMSRSAEAVARFEREAMAASHIEHPNVAAATDFGALDDGAFFLVLEYVEGRTLREVVSADAVGGGLPPARALHITRQIASGLASAHALGIVHRDLKPENLVLSPRDGDDDFVKILDFGIAKVPLEDSPPQDASPDSPDDAPAKPAKPEPLTKLGMVYGTPEYMAPEQAMGRPIDARVDLYALGVILFELVSGVRPFDDDNKVVLLGQHVSEPVPQLVKAPPEIEAIVRKLMAKSPNDRFQTADELIAALDAVPQSDAPRVGAPSGAPIAKQLVTLPLGALPPPPAPTRAPHSPIRRVVEHVLARTEEVLPLDRVPLPLTRRQKVWVACGAAALLLFVVATLVTVVAVRLGRHTSSASGASGAGSTSGGDHRVKCLAASAAGDRGAVVREATAWASESANATAAQTDADVARAVGAAALDPAASDAAFGLLETKLGSAGADVLYDLAYGSAAATPTPTSERAKRALRDDTVKPHMSAALGVTVAIRTAATPCEAKTKFFAQAAKDGDARTLDALTPWLKRGGCGRKGRRDCHPCLRLGADSVEKTAAAIRARVQPQTPAL